MRKRHKKKNRQEQLVALIANYKQRSRFAFKSAEKQTDEYGKKFIEHGAICYFNCWRDLEALLCH